MKERETLEDLSNKETENLHSIEEEEEMEKVEDLSINEIENLHSPGEMGDLTLLLGQIDRIRAKLDSTSKLSFLCLSLTLLQFLFVIFVLYHYQNYLKVFSREETEDPTPLLLGQIDAIRKEVDSNSKLSMLFLYLTLFQFVLVFFVLYYYRLK